MQPWFTPLQLLTALGITVPLFVYYTWRLYSLVIEHDQGIKSFEDFSWVNDLLDNYWTITQISAQLSISRIFLRYDTEIGSLRRSLKGDVNNIILVGFIGTLLGMLGSFASLILFIGNEALNPATLISALIKGGVSTALVSSLIASILAVLVLWYLSHTEKQLAVIKEKLTAHVYAIYMETHTEKYSEEVSTEAHAEDCPENGNRTVEPMEVKIQ